MINNNFMKNRKKSESLTDCPAYINFVVLVREYDKKLRKALRVYKITGQAADITSTIFWSICRFVPANNWDCELGQAIVWEGENVNMPPKKIRKALKKAGINKIYGRKEYKRASKKSKR